MEFRGLNAGIGRRDVLLCGVQHVLAMFVGLITPPLIVAGALGLPVDDVSFLLSMALVTSGVTTLMQVAGWGPVGSGLLSVQGTSFTFVPLAIQAGADQGLSLVFGMAMAAAPVEIVFSRMTPLLRVMFPPIVTGSVVMLIGMSLVGFGLVDIAGGYGSESYGATTNFAMGGLVLILIVGLSWFASGAVATVSIALALGIGYGLAAALGWVDFAPVARAPWFAMPAPMAYGLDFDVRYLFPWIIGYFITTMEAIGDLTATSEVSGEPVSGETYDARVKGGLLADGIGSLAAALFNAMPNTTFSQNNGVIALTRVGTRSVGFVVGGVLILLGLFPKFGALVGVMPKPVLGGATIVLFGIVAVSGLRIATSEGFGRREQFILAVALALGLGVTIQPDAVAVLEVPDSLKVLLQSGLAVGAMTSALLNQILPRPE